MLLCFTANKDIQKSEAVKSNKLNSVLQTFVNNYEILF